MTLDEFMAFSQRHACTGACVDCMIGCHADHENDEDEVPDDE